MLPSVDDRSELCPPVVNFFEKISTHLLTVLIIGAIVQIEQRKRKRIPNPEVPNTTLRIASIVLKYSFHIYERRYDLC